MWNEQIIMMLLEGIKDTLYMTLTSEIIVTFYQHKSGTLSMRKCHFINV